jgi:transposase-like protein
MAKRAKKRDTERAAYWRRVIRRQKASGRSIRAFCLSEGLKESAYYHWRRELARRDAESPAQNPDSASTATLVPVQLLDDRNVAAPVEIVAGNGYVIRVSETATTDHVRRVLRAVGEPD